MGQNAWHLNNESSVPSLTSCGACSIEKSTRTSEGDAAPGNNLMDGETVKRHKVSGSGEGKKDDQEGRPQS